MATGAGLGGLVTALLPLVGLVTMVKARQRRKRGLPEPVDETFEKRRAATRESEARMAAYLAQRGSASYQVTEDDEQEIRR
ncbi:MAG: hypothetical protein EON48_13005 [Acetobacteraceae bacterium]|nr:MAG: hypothetical protein EON48_13005 [Acetobacteraceae bacterium]